MKPPRVVVLSLGILAVLLLLAVGLAFNSSVQTWAARRALASQPQLNATIESVSVGLSSVELRGFRAESDGAVLTLPAMTAELPVAAAGLREQVAIKSLVAKGWILDLTKVKDSTGAVALSKGTRLPANSRPSRGFSLVSTAYAADPAASVEPLFRGVFADLQLPVDLSLDGVDLEGEVILPDMDGAGASRLQITLRGGGLQAGQEGSFRVEAAGTKPDGGSLAVHGTLTGMMDTPRTFTQLGVAANASASAPQFPQGVELKIDGRAVRKSGGESYALLLAGADKQLAEISAELVAAAARISGTWKLDVRDRDLNPFVLGKSLPAFTATGQGGFETGTTLKEIHASGRLNASADRLEAVRAELGAVGAVSIAADFDVLQHADSLRVERMDATITAAEPVMRIHALQPFEFNLGTGELSVADPTQDLVALLLTGLPVEWVRPFTGELELTGGNLSGEFSASARNGGLALRPKTPLRIAGLNVKRGDEPLLAGVDLLLTASGDYTPRGWQVEVVEFTARAQERTLLVLNAKAGKLSDDGEGLKATGRWNADLPGWAMQPVGSTNFQISAGAAQGDFSASFGDTQAIEAKIAFSNLVAASNEKLPTINADVRADVTAAGRMTFNTALLFEQEGRKSDLLLAGTMTPEAELSVIDARISSQSVVLDDVKLLAVILPSEAGEEPAPDSPDAVPFWSGFKGQATLDLKKVIYGGSYEVADVVGILKIEPAGLKLEGVHAVFGPESELKMNGEVTFRPEVEKSYAFTGNMALNNFDTTLAFRAIDPAKLPTVETRMNLAGKITGSGASLALLAEGAQGRFDLTSKGGVFRALATVLPEERIQATQTALSVVGGLFGGTSSSEMIATANEIVKLVSEIQFDQLSVSAQRDENQNLVLQDFNLIAPYVRLGGEGLIQYTPGKSLLDQALDLRITLGARGRLGELLNKWKLLKAEKDGLGYTAFVTPIKIGGTVGNTDSRDFQAKLLSVALEKSGVGDALNRILGGSSKKPEEER